jgi:SpoVK/Ycf46/Vps4 family AAA+-type ATPase
MRDYEDHLLRQYARNALYRDGRAVITRPPQPLAAWLFEHAELLGCSSPETDQEAFDLPYGHVRREVWAQFAPLVAELKRPIQAPAPSPLARRLAWLCDLLKLTALESEVLGAAVRVRLHRRVRALAQAFDVVSCVGSEIYPLGIAILLGREEREMARVLQPSRTLCLMNILVSEEGGYTPSKPVMRVARMETTDPARLRAALVGKTQKPELDWEDFGHLGDTIGLAERLIRAALAKRTRGVNILLHGAPGTGKTAFARTLAARLEAHALFVGETDDDDGEPTRAERISAFAIAQSLAGPGARTLLVVDEADDIFTGVDEDDAGSRKGSKVFMNRLVERTTAPTIWITNNKARLGEAVLRRMSLAIRFPEPGRAVRRGVAERIAARRKLRLPAAALDGLAEVRVSPAVLDSAFRVAKLTGGGAADIERAARSVAQAMEGAPTPPAIAGAIPFDPALCETDTDLAALADRLCVGGETALSFCLHGLPGTGKSAYARYLAERLGLDVIEKRASDLLSKWVGDSEKQIAQAFEEAADRRAMLILDEADSLLRDRAGARASWEVTQVNELLTWMERHPYPFACTTNLMETLDPATLRRFLFKIKFLPMRPDQAREAFRRSFGLEAPRGLEALEGLAPGDFALVARKARVLGLREAAELLAMLEAELAAKAGGVRRRIGF